MARIKLYYPVDEITNNLYTTGQEFMTLDNVEYIGAFHKYITGEVYTQETWNPKLSKKLIPYKQQVTEVNTIYKKLKPDIRLKYSAPRAVVVQPNKTDITAGFISRYFIKQQNDNTIIEIDKLQYDNWSNNVIDRKMHQAVQITWYIAGTISDSYDGTVFVPGVISKNQQQIAIASQTISNLSSYLTNLTEFYTDNDYSTPIDINGLDS